MRRAKRPGPANCSLNFTDGGTSDRHMGALERAEMRACAAALRTRQAAGILHAGILLRGVGWLVISFSTSASASSKLSISHCPLFWACRQYSARCKCQPTAVAVQSGFRARQAQNSKHSNIQTPSLASPRVVVQALQRAAGTFCKDSHGSGREARGIPHPFSSIRHPSLPVQGSRSLDTSHLRPSKPASRLAFVAIRQHASVLGRHSAS